MDSGNPMLIQIDPIHSPHEHESGTAFLPKLLLQWLPVCFHFSSPRFIAEGLGLVGPSFVCSTAEPFHSVLVSVALAGGVPLRWGAEYCSHAALRPAALLHHVPSRLSHDEVEPRVSWHSDN